MAVTKVMITTVMVVGDLELEELAYRVIETPAPHDSFDDGREVVIHQDDVRCLFGDLGPCDTHREPHMRCLESAPIVGAGPSYANDVTVFLERFNQ